LRRALEHVRRMASRIPAQLRRLVADRAEHLCEYCLVHQEDRGFGCQVDHIISEKHGGQTDANNLAYACAPCNRAKGSDVGSVVETHAGGMTQECLYLHFKSFAPRGSS